MEYSLCDERTGTYSFAGCAVRIESLYREIHLMCRDYAADEPADFAVTTAPSDIDFERRSTLGAKWYAPASPVGDAYLETLAVYRKIAEKMPEYDGFLFHGSCIAVDDVCYLFAAKSGTGKSTHSRLWREMLGDRAVMVNDDKPLIRVTGEGAIAYGTPWDGKHRLSSNIAVPLKAVCILSRGAENRIRQVTKSEAMPMLVQQTYRPADPAALAKTLDLIDRLDVRFYCLSCNMDISAAELSYNTMKG